MMYRVSEKKLTPVRNNTSVVKSHIIIHIIKLYMHLVRMVTYIHYPIP
jgi:hypothetical protein